MADGDAIEKYVRELEASLRRAGRPTEPLVDEARAHLYEDAARIARAEGCSDAEAARRAIARFGDVPEVVAASRRYGRTLAASVARISSLVMLAAFAWTDYSRSSSTSPMAGRSGAHSELLAGRFCFFARAHRSSSSSLLRALAGRGIASRWLTTALQLHAALALALLLTGSARRPSSLTQLRGRTGRSIYVVRGHRLPTSGCGSLIVRADACVRACARSVRSRRSSRSSEWPMSNRDAIDEYVRELEASLRRAARPTQPLADEARAHLHEDAARIAAAEGCGDAEAARRAVARFGVVGEVMRAVRRNSPDRRRASGARRDRAAARRGWPGRWSTRSAPASCGRRAGRICGYRSWPRSCS